MAALEAALLAALLAAGQGDTHTHTQEYSCVFLCETAPPLEKL